MQKELVLFCYCKDQLVRVLSLNYSTFTDQHLSYQHRTQYSAQGHTDIDQKEHARTFSLKKKEKLFWYGSRLDPRGWSFRDVFQRIINTLCSSYLLRAGLADLSESLCASASATELSLETRFLWSSAPLKKQRERHTQRHHQEKYLVLKQQASHYICSQQTKKKVKIF